MNCALSVVGCRLSARRLLRGTDSCVTAKAPSSAFGTLRLASLAQGRLFSPAEKRGGEGLSMGRCRERDTNSRLLTTRPRRRQPTTNNAQRAINRQATTREAQSTDNAQRAA